MTETGMEERIIEAKKTALIINYLVLKITACLSIIKPKQNVNTKHYSSSKWPTQVALICRLFFSSFYILIKFALQKKIKKLSNSNDDST